MGDSIAVRESARLVVQDRLDAARSAEERNRAGQFATPPLLATVLAEQALKHYPNPTFSMLEPSCGTGALISATLTVAGTLNKTPNRIVGIESDPELAQVGAKLWDTNSTAIENRDFMHTPVREKFDLLVANPPYVRHQLLDSETKREYRQIAAESSGVVPSGLSGLYVYFILAAHQHLADKAISVWLVPADFLDTNYGGPLRDYLSRKVTLLRVHRFDPDSPLFDDALTTSSIIVFRNEKPDKNRRVLFTEGRSLTDPAVSRVLDVGKLGGVSRWGRLFTSQAEPSAGGVSRLGDFFDIRRGIVTGGNKFFIMPRREAEARGINTSLLTPILPGPRFLDRQTVQADSEGWPIVGEQLVLLSSSAPLGVLGRENPGLAEYFGTVDAATRNSYTVTHREPWYGVEFRLPPPFLLTYLGRPAGGGVPFRVVLNYSRAVATNNYLLLYPKGVLAEMVASGAVSLGDVFHALESIGADSFLVESRVCGGGLRRIEPGGLAEVDAAPISKLVG